MLSYYIPSNIYTEQIHGISHLLANIEYNIELVPFIYMIFYLQTAD